MALEPTGATVGLAVASGLGAAIGMSFVDTASMALFGVPAIVVVFSCIGAVAALAYRDPIRPWVRLALLLLANAMAGIVAALALPMMPGLEWTKALPSQAVSFGAAFVSLWVTPLLISRLPGMTAAVIPVQPDGEKGGPHA